MTTNSMPEWLLARVHRLGSTAKDARQRSDDAGTALLTLQTQLDDVESHLANVPDVHPKDDVPGRKERIEARKKELTEQHASLAPQVENQREFATRARDFEQAVAAVYQNCERWLDGYHDPHAIFEQVDIAPTQGDPVKRLEQVRKEVTSLTDEIEKVSNAPVARTDLQHQVDAFVGKLWEMGEPEIKIDDGGNVDIQMGGLSMLKRITPKHVLALFAWMQPDLFTQKIQGIVDSIPIPVDALPVEVKKKKYAELDAQRTAALFEMGALARQCIDQGLVVALSERLSPEHLLGVRVRPRLEAVA